MKGPGVFKEYLNKPEATAEAFDSKGWFRYFIMHPFFPLQDACDVGPLCSRLSSLWCTQLDFHLRAFLIVV